jgi:hypothetical protein
MDLDRNIPKATRSLTTLGHMRVLGIRRFQARCLNPQCLHEVLSLISNDLPDGMTLASMGARMICKRCNKFGADVWPDWKRSVRPEHNAQKQARAPASPTGSPSRSPA